eukprot:PITA_22142
MGGASKPSPSSTRKPPVQPTSLSSEPRHEEEDHESLPRQQNTNKSMHQIEQGNNKSDGKPETEQRHRITSKTCKPVAAERPKIKLPNHRVNGQIQFMKDHALIGKFISFWPTKKELQGWISTKWKPKGHVTLQLGPKGFFTVIFLCIEDRNRIIDEGPYFFNSAGLYLRAWVERFNPDKEDLSWAIVWIRMYLLPAEYWDEDSLKDIGNGLGEFVKSTEETKLRRYTSYARICVFMRLDKPLPHSRLSSQSQFPKCCTSEKPDQDGFIKVASHKRTHKKAPSGKKSQQDASSLPSISNSFEVLANPSTDHLLHSPPNPKPSASPATPYPSGSPLGPAPLSPPRIPPRWLARSQTEK